MSSECKVFYNSGGKFCSTAEGHLNMNYSQDVGKIFIRTRSIDLLPTRDTFVNDGTYTLQDNFFYFEGFRFKGWRVRPMVNGKHFFMLENGTYVRRENFNLAKNGPCKLFNPHEMIPVIELDGVNIVVFEAVWENGDDNTSQPLDTGDNYLISAPEHVAENKAILRKKLLQRPIVLFGGGSFVCKDFYQKYHKILNIRCILTDRNEEKQIKLDDGTILEVEPYEKNKIRPDDYIIVCRRVTVWGDEYYKNARNTLIRDGFEHIKDFVRSSIAGVVLDEKKLWLWMGYCQFDIISQILAKVEEISRDFVLESVRVGMDTVKTSYKFQDCQDMVKICDVFVYLPLIVAEGKRDFDFMDFLPKDAKILSIPRINFRGYYPYKDSDIETRHKYTYDGRIHWPFKHAENFLDELILKGMNDDDIYKEVMREDFIDEKVIQKNLRLTFKSIQISEDTTDIKILDYIKDNLTDHMLYSDGLHYHNDLYFELARRVSKHLNIDVIDEINNLEREAEETGMEYHVFTEIPVLPCVAKTLGMDFITDDTLWRVKFTENGQEITSKYEIRMMTRKEWIYAYLAFTRAQMTLLDFWNLKNDK